MNPTVPRRVGTMPAVLRVVWWSGAVLAGVAVGAVVVSAIGVSYPGLPLVVPATLDLTDSVAVAQADGRLEGVVGRADARLRLTETDAATVGLWSALLASWVVGALWGLHLVRGLVRTVAAGRPFDPGNVVRLRLMSLLVVGVTVADQTGRAALQWHLARVADLEGADFGVPWRPPIIAAVLAIALASVAAAFRHGSLLQADADVTV